MFDKNSDLARRSLLDVFVDLNQLTTQPILEYSTVKTSNSEPRSAAFHRATKSLPHWYCVLALPLMVSTGLAEEAVPSKFHVVSNFEFADKYLTPRGMIVHDDGVAFQWLALGLLNVYHDETFVSDVTLVGGVWNDFSSEGVSIDAPFGKGPTTSYVEIDPIAGVSVSFAKQFKLDVTYTAFAMQILDIGTSHHLETKLGFDDTPYLKAFALHPYLF